MKIYSRKLLKNMLIILFLVVTNITLYTKSACIIVHGTWAQKSSWYQKGGNFYEAVYRANQQHNIVHELISFSWSGLLGDLAQKQAAQDLAKLIFQYDKVILIAHSHGATVGITSSQIIGQKNSDGNFCGKIEKFYALGVPVDSTRTVYPDMNVIGSFYNLFSFGDYIQTVHGIYERIFGAHERISNIAVTIKKYHPTHSELHDAIIGEHLLCIPEIYGAHDVGNFKKYQHGAPAQLNFVDNFYPWYDLQLDQDNLIRLDKLAFELMQKAFFRGLSREDHLNQPDLADD